MSDFIIFKAAFNNSATPAVGTYTAEGATALFNLNASISPDYYLYNTVDDTAVQWFVPTAETTDFEFVADILTRNWTNRVTYFIIADSTGATRLRMWSQYNNWFFENSDSIDSSRTEYIGVINPTTSGGFGVFHQFRVRVRKLTASSSSVEVYVDGALKLTATAGAALVTCAKIGFVGGVNTFGPGTAAGIKNAYVYDLSGGDVIDRGVLSGAFNRFISWMKSKFALKSDIPTVNNGTLTIQKNGTNVATFTANQSTAATANITVPVNTSDLVNDSGYLTSSSNLDASKLTSGTVDIARLPQGALERLVKVANEAARYALTTADVQLGDTVQQLDTGIMYVVTDTDHLDSAAGYTEYTAGTAASVPWSGVTGKPTFAAVATSGAYSDLTGTPTIPTVNNGTLTIQQNGVNVQTFTANQSTAVTANIQCVDLTSAQTIGGDKEFTGTTTAHDVVPSATDTYNFGSPSYQWNNAYIKSLTINGVACGDILTHNASEFVDVTSAQTIGGVKTFSDIPIVVNSKAYVSKINANRTDGTQAGFSPNNGFKIVCNNDSQAWVNTVFAIHVTEYSPTAGTVAFKLFDCIEGSTSYKGFLFRKGDNDSQFSPTASGSTDLGTSTNKWKSLNGINPGALSLPRTTGLIDISSSITSLDGATINNFTPQVDGWLLINGTGLANDAFIYVSQGRIGMKSANNASDNRCAVLIPVVAGVEVSVTCKLSALTWANIAPCQGNV